MRITYNVFRIMYKKLTSSKVAGVIRTTRYVIRQTGGLL